MSDCASIELRTDTIETVQQISSRLNRPVGFPLSRITPRYKIAEDLRSSLSFRHSDTDRAREPFFYVPTKDKDAGTKTTSGHPGIRPTSNYGNQPFQPTPGFGVLFHVPIRRIVGSDPLRGMTHRSWFELLVSSGLVKLPRNSSHSVDLVNPQPS